MDTRSVDTSARGAFPNSAVSYGQRAVSVAAAQGDRARRRAGVASFLFIYPFTGRLARASDTRRPNLNLRLLSARSAATAAGRAGCVYRITGQMPPARPTGCANGRCRARRRVSVAGGRATTGCAETPDVGGKGAADAKAHRTTARASLTDAPVRLRLNIESCAEAAVGSAVLWIHRVALCCAVPFLR